MPIKGLAICAAVLAHMFAVAGEGLRFESAQTLIRIRNCTDQVGCRADSCTDLSSPYSPAPENTCVPLSQAAGLAAGSYGRFRCVRDRVGVCNPTEVFFGSPCQGTPMQVITTPMPSCMQLSPRYQYPVVVDNNEGPNGGEQFRTFVESCSDARCKKCTPVNHTSNPGMPPNFCYAHPGVPGLYLFYKDLVTCSLIELDGYDTLEQCQNNPLEPISSTTLPSQGKCWGGISLTCQGPQ